MEMIFVDDYYYYKKYYLSTGTGAKELFKLPFMYEDMEYCALIEEDKVVIYKVPTKIEELGLKESFNGNVMNIEKYKPLAKTIIPEGIISKIDIGTMNVTFSLDQTSSIFDLPTGSNTITMGQTVEGLLYAICATDKGKDLYLFTYNENNKASEWVKTEENALNIEMLNSFAYKVSTKDKQRVVNFTTHHVLNFRPDVTITPLKTLEASSIDIVHSFINDERKDWTHLGEELYCYYLLKNGNKTTIQMFSQLIYNKENVYSLKNIFSGSLDNVQYLQDIKRLLSKPDGKEKVDNELKPKIDEHVVLNAICGFRNGDLVFAYPIMFLDNNLVRTDNPVNISGSLSIESPNIFFLSYSGNGKKSFHIYERFCRNGDRRIECSESKRHDELAIIPGTNQHILIGVNHQVLDDYQPEDHYYLYYCDSIYNKVLADDAYHMDSLGDDGYIFYLREEDKWIVKVFDKKGSMSCISQPIENINDLKKDYIKEFHLLILKYKDSMAIIHPMKASTIDFDFLNIKDYRIVTIGEGICKGNFSRTMLLEYETNKPNNTGLKHDGYNHPKKYIWFTADGNLYLCDFSRYYHVRHIEGYYFEVQPYPNGPVNIIIADINGHRHCDAREIMGYQKKITSLIEEK